MDMNSSIIIAIGAAAIFMFLLWVILAKKDHKKQVKIQDASLTCEELEDHARETAVEHIISNKTNMAYWPVPQMNENYDFIRSVYEGLNRDAQKKHTIPPAAEWLLDNFYIVEEQVKSIRKDLKKEDYAKLPVLKCGHLKGYARSYAIAMELVAHTNGKVDDQVLINYLKAYQTHSVLLDREIWALSTLLRLAIVENIRDICEKIKNAIHQWHEAEETLDHLLDISPEDTMAQIKVLENTLRGQKNVDASFIEHLSYRLRKERRNFVPVLHSMDAFLKKQGTSLQEITKKEHSAQATHSVSIGNSVTSLKFISTLDFTEIFEFSSYIEQTLRQDPDGTYPRMDLPSRNQYRKTIEELAEEFGVSEIRIAKEALDLAHAACNTHRGDGQKDEDPHQAVCHIGYYLIGKGKSQLEESIGYAPEGVKRIHRVLAKHPAALYLGSILLITLLLTGGAMYAIFYAAAKFPFWLSLAGGIAVFIPASDIAVCITNWIACKIFKPSTFPRLELKEGIPDTLRTMVVVPALLTDEKRVYELLENLETYYLANKEDHLFFALAGDFKDAPSKEMKGDRRIVDAGIQGVKKLNERYSKEGTDIFYFFHRERLHNAKDNKWMGWERKRGALIEFNDLLLGSKSTSYTLCSSKSLPFSKVKYVITLDADTILPIDGARRMIGTMAHPLNRPSIDKGRGIVTEGYGLLQPRINYDIESANKSLFSRIFTGQEGLDPYACAVSDAYQDIFGEGIFTGKGIYDLNIFQSVLKQALPDNAILSHDLLEGSYVRAALATDLEFVDSFPSKYNAYAMRMHRWIRGDWQLVPWLRRTVRDKKGRKVKNPLTLIAKWKIIDNLRRSLVSPALMLLIALGFSILPGSSFLWTLSAIFVMAFSLITATIDYMLSKPFGRYRAKRHLPVISGIKATFYQILLMFVFLPYQAYLIAHAVVITLGRVFITKRNMLEWVTAADAEKGQKNSLRSYFRKMAPALFQGVLIVALAFIFKPSTVPLSALLLVLWAISPWVGYWVSKPMDVVPVKLSDNHIVQLRKLSRKTWRYFEEFMNHKNHYLPPDNYQQDPPNGVAYRTSPTNIGLGMLCTLSARDMGYISTPEMANTLLKTISTIEKMEKWHGHLYNWYNTHTLRPLKPRYISTVDSGNFVCYLITLAQGLEEYLHQPLADKKLMEGIRDTLMLAGDPSDPVVQSLALLNDITSKEPFDLVLWHQTLNELHQQLSQLNVKKSPWENKVLHSIYLLRKETLHYFPWIPFIEELSSGSPNESGENTGESEHASYGLLERLKIPVTLKDMPGHINNIIKDLDQGMRNKNLNGDLQRWNELKDTLENAIENSQHLIAKLEGLRARIQEVSDSTRFVPLYDEKKQLFSIGFNIEENRLTNSYYDLLASEARQTSYIAIARGEVPPRHWFKLGRALTVVDGYKGLVSWTGTMFEYFMPLLLMKSYKNTLLDETYSFVIRSQKKYGKQRRIPWGVSESGFYALDINLDYQYKAIGVPWLGLKRGLVEDAVVAPYAAVLALPVEPLSVMKNLEFLKAEGMEGPYGFYEAIDYTPARMPFGLKKALVKSFMAHHQGMSLLAFNNYLNQDIMQARFHRDPVVKGAQLLLQEKVPTEIVFTKENKEKVLPFKEVVYKDEIPIRKFESPDPVLPKAHILTNGNYSVLLTDRGTGYSKNKMASITRWREDSIFGSYGMFFYIRNADTNGVWSATDHPYPVKPEAYEVVFSSDKAAFSRKDGDIETHTEVIVTTEDNAELRRITLKNRGDQPYTLEVISYFEVVLASQGADVAHPAFSNLFVRTEFLPAYSSLIANRRPRSESEKSLWLANVPIVEGEMVGGIEYETDRIQFIGRGNTVSNPGVIEMNKPLTNSSGPVLDPIMSLKARVKVEPGKEVRISYLAGVGESRDAVLALVEKYSRPDRVKDAFKMALTRSQMEARYLNISAEDTQVYQEAISHILFVSPLRQLDTEEISKNQKGQSSLWAYGISGDLPIVLVILKDTQEIEIVYEVLKAHEYWRIRDLKVDLVILNEEENTYNHPVRALLSDAVSSVYTQDIFNKPGGVFVLNRNTMPQEDIYLLYAVARLILKGNAGSLEEQIRIPSDVKDNMLLKEPIKLASTQRVFPEPTEKAEKGKPADHPVEQPSELTYFNGLGGFDHSGQEYVIKLHKNQNTPLPWINVIANPAFGFLVSESGSGYTWCENSRENKLTPWSNDPVSDIPGEVLYIGDRETHEVWTATPLPIREDGMYVVRHGFGYSAFEHTSHGIGQELVQFIPVNQTVSIRLLKLKNISGRKRKLTLAFYVRPVMGVSDQFTAMHINTGQSESGTLLVRNRYNEEFAGRVMFIETSEKDRSVTGNRKEFFGNGNLENPQALHLESLPGTLGTGHDPCAAMQVEVMLDENEEKELVFLMGMGKGEKDALDIASHHRSLSNAKYALQEVKNFWHSKLGAVQVKTPDPSMDFMLNGWLLYQVISCRIWARSAFYQSGGAFGFRDQLQDSLSVAHIWPEITRNQILLHAKHQFVEGDVQHWWHEPQNKGTRTKFSDDLLWLPFVTAEYINITGDEGILKEPLPFMEDESLNEFEDERYSIPRVSLESASLYEHCSRAIERSLKQGEHGLPLMGSGDWNDGMSTVGNEGKGESVWLAWFLYDTLNKFAPLCGKMGDTERETRYRKAAQDLVNAIETHAWDGNWYRRAYFDNGLPLGSIENSECTIDSISQSWAVISEAASQERIRQAMDSLENYLVHREEGLIKLLTPPFDEGDLEPGYIKGYVPGVRENGGQYTHAAAWTIIAFAKMGDGDKAWELFELVNPINHTRTHIEYSKYKVEPYVMSADVYAVEPHVGRGGWTWYTGSAGWIYRAGIEYILGFKKQGQTLVMDPCIPKRWEQYSIKYRYQDTDYTIHVINKKGVNRGVERVKVDGKVSEGNIIPLVDDKASHEVEVHMG